MTIYIVTDNVWCLAQLKENIAKVRVDLETGQIFDIQLYERNLRFKCKGCAIYCCKLGGPSLTKKDIERIESAGYDISEFSEPVKRQYRNFPLMSSTLKSKKDGLCVFLKTDKESNTYECSIYDIRPSLCRLYPFEIKRIKTDSFLLKIIPCCNGLNNLDGELVDEKFITNYLVDFIEIFVETRKRGVKK